MLNMDITTLIIFFILLVFLLAVLMFFFFTSVKKKTNKSTKTQGKSFPLEVLIKRLKDKKLSTQELKNTVNAVLKDYGVIDNFDAYVDIIYRITSHPHANKDIILSFEKSLSKLNPNYASLISKNIMDALKLR